MSQEEPSEDELRAALEEQMRHIHVQDVLAQTVVTLINLSARRLGLTGSPEEVGERDPEQARLGIEGARALMPLLPEDAQKQLREPLSQLQMAFAQMAAPGGQPVGEAAPPSQQDAGDRSPEPGDDGAAAGAEAERAKARSKIWTPPGT